MPRDPTGRAYIALRLLWGWTGDWLGVGEQRRTRDTSVLEVPLILTVQITRRPRWGDSGRWTEQDGESQNIYRFFFERVSCSPGWLTTGNAGRYDLELLLSPSPKRWSDRCLTPSCL